MRPRAYALYTTACVGTVLAYHALVFDSVLAWLKSLGPSPLLLHDFVGIYYPMGEAILQGATQPVFGFLYPPVSALVFAAIALLPAEVAPWLWGGLVVASTLALPTVARRALPEAPPWVEPVALTLLVWSIPTWHNLRFGQVSAMLLLLLLASVVDQQAGRPRRAALWLAMAAAVKPHLLVFALPLVIRREGRALAWLTLFLSVLLFVLPALVLGPLGTLGFYANVVWQMADRFGSGEWDYSSQLLANAALRIADTKDWPWVVGVERVVRVAGLIGCGWWIWRRARDPHPSGLRDAACILLCSTPLWVPSNWPHYFVFLPICQAWVAVDVMNQAHRLRRRLAGVALVASIAMLSVFAFHASPHRIWYFGWAFPIWSSALVLLAHWMAISGRRLAISGQRLAISGQRLAISDQRSADT
ncbi:MAG: DUF2029 domain-containing protein [Myxococcales bacterium]|nr:DUF2029 domain-containing protein [Myxococcales bacterium]